MRRISVSGPGWVAANADYDEIKDFFRSIIGMDLRQAEERVATKSVLWSYTALRHFVRATYLPLLNTTYKYTGRHSLIMSQYAANAVSIPSAFYLTTTPSTPTSKLSKVYPLPPSPNPHTSDFSLTASEHCKKPVNSRTPTPPSMAEIGIPNGVPKSKSGTNGCLRRYGE